MEYQLLDRDRLSWQYFCRLADVINNIPDRNTI
ncbi:hypothetical protein [Photorhabdus sp. RW14-46]|nr:hypothetical protein [Photorhabdus sp. RW14-46]